MKNDIHFTNLDLQPIVKYTFYLQSNEMVDAKNGPFVQKFIWIAGKRSPLNSKNPTFC